MNPCTSKKKNKETRRLITVKDEKKEETQILGKQTVGERRKTGRGTEEDEGWKEEDYLQASFPRVLFILYNVEMTWKEEKVELLPAKNDVAIYGPRNISFDQMTHL